MKTTNRIVMVLWGLIIFGMWGIIITIAYKQKDLEYESLASDLKKAASIYIKRKDIKLSLNESYKIYIDDLKNENFINNDEKIKDYCIDSIVVSKDIFNYSYEINKECKSEE